MRFAPHAALALALAAAPVAAADVPSPGEIVAAAPAAEWVAIAAEDLLIMTLTPDAKGRTRRVVIQLMPAPFSQGWVGNIRVLAKAHWWDGTAVTRVQDNYVAQWGDPDGEDAAKAKPLPAGLRTMAESEYVVPPYHDGESVVRRVTGPRDFYADRATFRQGWPVAGAKDGSTWPVHCYGMVGVGRNLSPDTGTGAELYTVIGHAPRHLDRNIALVGRVVEGIEHLSSLPRGTGPLGVYETAEERTPIVSIRLASELPAGERPRFEYLSTEGATFARYVEARANRRDAFFITPAGGADVCNVPVPVRRVAAR
ncbi:peptidylprolyl isomerase [Sphingomonas sp.]|uniref:peptidylprolyl isomerase n=1 Tax=Sphingomonas sp. TaxID=28214 RepID=UPI0035C7CCD8